MLKKDIALKSTNTAKPTVAYVFATWGTLLIGILSYLIGLWNSTFELNEKGFYFAVFLLGMFAAITLQKTIRDREEGFPVTQIFMVTCWVAFGFAIALLVIGLINASIILSEKGFYGISFLLSLFAVITVQKNTRDLTNVSGTTDSLVASKTKQSSEAISGTSVKPKNSSLQDKK